MLVRRENAFQIATIAVLVLGIGLCGCSTDGQGGADKADTAGAEKALSAASIAALVKADAADGKVDKVVSKCLTCGLGMDGKADHSTKVGEYVLHLCKEGCKKMVEADPEKALASLPE